jgi:hypothetical protein
VTSELENWRGTMMNDLDIDRAAGLLVRLYREQAHSHATARADQLYEAGHVDGWLAWLKIRSAVQELTGAE